MEWQYFFDWEQFRGWISTELGHQNPIGIYPKLIHAKFQCLRAHLGECNKDDCDRIYRQTQRGRDTTSPLQRVWIMVGRKQRRGRGHISKLVAENISNWKCNADHSNISNLRNHLVKQKIHLKGEDFSVGQHESQVPCSSRSCWCKHTTYLRPPWTTKQMRHWQLPYNYVIKLATGNSLVLTDH